MKVTLYRAIACLVSMVVQAILLVGVCTFVLITFALLEGCTASRQTSSQGRATIITTDTTHIEHGGVLQISKTLFNK